MGGAVVLRDDPTATYRGYRKQALYVLWRILTDVKSESQSYRPEGEEDLAVFDNGGLLVEAVQVKDYTGPLVLSDFKPHSPAGFFARMKRRQVEHPTCRHSLASFGPLGTELDGAIGDTGKHRQIVACKLNEKNPSISPSDANSLLESLKNNVSRPDESQLKADVLLAITGTIAGVQGGVALELLLYWVFDASENLRTLTRLSLLQQLQRIGDYLSALRDHTSEWMVAVRPLEVKELLEEESKQLRQEYRSGVQARWKHIIADADCPRPVRLIELHEKIIRHSVVIVRGASGQGKSSLALRYLFDYCADGLRFHVRFVDGREHAHRIANVLRGHVARLRLRAVVLLDLAPTDSGWLELVRELTDVGLKVIVTVREEDFRRAGAIASDFDCAEVVLDAIAREEAELIYASLSLDGRAGSTLDFEEAWARFSTAEAGPLLEFTHLVHEGETLRAKVESQVIRLQREAGSSGPDSGCTTSHLRLLALAAVANAFECRVQLRELCASTGLDPLTHPLQVLENEYFLRCSGAGAIQTVGGLHSLRSQAIEAALLRDCPEMWLDLAVQCLPLVVDEDIERFLLCSFSRHPQYSVTLEGALRGLPLRTWTHAGGIGRALLWEGANRYQKENHSVIVDAISEHSNAWWMLCDVYLSLDSDFSEGLRKTLTEVFKKEIPTISLTEKTRVFIPFRDWAACVQPPLLPANSATDWTLAGDLSFWLGKENIEAPLTVALRQLLPEPLPEQLSLSDLAQFISGRCALGGDAFTTWHAHYEAEFTARFIRETKSIHVTDDGEEVKVFFPVVIADAVLGEDPDAHNLHAQAIKRVQLLRELYPHRARFGSQGLGMEVLEAFIPHDETIKSIPVESLHLERAVQFNSTFRNLVSYRLQRADSWGAYAETALEFRKTVCELFRGLQRVWSRLLDEVEVKPKTVRQMPGAALDQVKALSNLPMFPRTVVDEWGFVSEDQDDFNKAGKKHLELKGNLSRFKKWKKSWSDYESGVGQVAARALDETLRHLSLKNYKQAECCSDSESESGRLLLINLGSAWEVLTEMQTEFRNWFARYVPLPQLDELEKHERSNFKHLWAVAFNFINGPLRRTSGGAVALERIMDNKRRDFLTQLKDELTATMSAAGTIKVSVGPHFVDGKRSLVVVCDHLSLETIEPLRSQAVMAIWRAAQAPSWQSLEWTPITIEWPNIFVTHVLRGKGLFPRGSNLSSSVLLGVNSGFEVKNHHVMEVPVQDSDYRALSLELWDSPLLSAAIKFQGELFAFILTFSRFDPIINIASEYCLSDEILKPSLTAFSQEISILRNNANMAFDDLENLMRVHLDTKTDAVKDLMGRLDKLCIDYLFISKTESDGELAITPDMFNDWFDRVSENVGEVNVLFSAIFDYALEVFPPAGECPLVG